MSASSQASGTEQFLRVLSEEYPEFHRSVEQTAREHPELFHSLGGRLVAWAKTLLDERAIPAMVQGYCEFCIDVGRSQAAYEKRGKYEYSSFEEVRAKTYDDPAFMTGYHWGVFATTFAWGHHLQLFDFYRSQFLPRLARLGEGARVIDLGSGSGIWSLLTLDHLDSVSSTLVDISETSVALTKQLVERVGVQDRTAVVLSDATTFAPDTPCDAGLSCFLLEHLEAPGDLLTNLARCIQGRGPAFVTAALTAAETDHIYEFRNESEVISLAEDCGFRVVSSLSLAPASVRPGARFLPRSMAMVLERKEGEIW